MPTKKKRVGFIPRKDVMIIIDKLSIENNLSNSKIISILVEEALSVRGIFNKKTGSLTHSYQEIKDNKEDLLYDSAYIKDNKKFKINNKSENYKNSGEINILRKINEETFDLETYKKFLSFQRFQEMIEEFNGL